MDHADHFPLALSLDEAAGVVVAVGELDMWTSPALQELMAGLIDAGGQRVWALDLTGLRFLDSMGVTALVEIHRQAAASGCALVVRNPSRLSRRVLEVTGVWPLLGEDQPGVPSRPAPAGLEGD